eukprot:tig00021723_g23232.t1
MARRTRSRAAGQSDGVRGTVTGAAPDFTPGAVKHDEHELVDGSIAVCQVVWAAVGDGLSSGADAVLAAVQSHVTSARDGVLLVPGGGVERHGVLDGARKDVENVTVGTPIPQSTTSVTVPVSWALRRWGTAGTLAPTYGRWSELLRGRRDADGLPGERTITAGATSASVTVLGLPENGRVVHDHVQRGQSDGHEMSTNSSTAASLFGRGGGARVEPRGGRVALALTPARSQVAKSVGPPSVTVSSSGADAVLAAVSWNTTGRRARSRLASETGTGSATVLVSAGSGRWQVQSHVTSCAATVYYSYLGVASSATAYSTVHAKTVENVTVGTPIPQSTTSVTVPVSWALSAVGYSGDNVAPTYGPLEVSCSGAGVTRTGSLASGTITAGATSANVTVLGLPEMGASYTITCSGANLTAYAGTVTGAAPDFTPGAASSTMSTNSSTAASLFAKSVGPPSVTVSSSGADAVLAAVSWNTTGASGTEPAYANVTVQSHVTSCAATVYYSYLGVASATAYSTVHAKTVENVTVGTPIPQSTTGDNVAPTYGPLEVSCSGAGVTRTGSLASGTITAGATSANVTVLGLPEMGASYTITCSGANLTATMSTNSSTAASLFAKSVGPPSVTVSSSGADAVLAAVSWNTTGASGTEPVRERDLASETGTGSATVLVSAGSGRWQVQSHVTSCAATVYYSYLGVASSATAYSTVHAKTVENVTVGTPIPQSTTSVTVPVSWALSAVGYSGDNVAPTYGPLEVSCSGAGVTRTGSLASGTITAGATSAMTVLGLPEMGASYTITCSGANLTAYAGTVTGAAPDFTPGAASSTMSTNSSTAASLFAKSVGPPSVTVSSSGADAVLAAVSWNTTGASGTEPAYANVTVSCSSNGVADSASNATVASETGTGSATVLVSAGSGRWQVQSHVTSCAATVYYSYLGWRRAPRRTRRTVENVTVGTPIPQSTTSVTVPVSWALSAVGYSGDNVAPTYGPLEVSCSGAGVTRTGSLASGTITAGATSANVTVLGLPEMGVVHDHVQRGQSDGVRGDRDGRGA